MKTRKSGVILVQHYTALQPYNLPMVSYTDSIKPIETQHLNETQSTNAGNIVNVDVDYSIAHFEAETYA